MGGDTFWRFFFLTIEDGIFEVPATAGDAHLGTEDFDSQIVDVRMQDPKRKNRGEDLAGNHLAVCHVRSQCERAKRTLCSSTQATMEIDALLDGTASPLAFSKAWFKELNMEYLRNSKGVLCDGGIDKRSVHDVVHVRGFARISLLQKMIQEFLNGKETNRPINPFLGAAVDTSIPKSCGCKRRWPES